MCLCKGTGGIKKVEGYVVKFAPCPDSHCEFDRDKAEREYQEWWKWYNEEMQKSKEESA